MNEREKEPCALSGPAPLPAWGLRSRVNAVGRNVFIEGAEFIPPRAVLSDFKHGLELACGESANPSHMRGFDGPVGRCCTRARLTLGSDFRLHV